MTTIASTPGHRWRFFRAGGFDQVRLDRGIDLAHLDELDQKLWVALACPTSGLEFDAKTLNLLDTDKDGRVRAPEVLAATRWTLRCLKNPDDLLQSAAVVRLDAINDATDEGKQVLASARQILSNLGKKDAASISIEDTTDTTRVFSLTKLNGDGIVPVESAEDAALGAVIAEIIACLGSEPDRSGKPGINKARLDTFFAEAKAFSDWHAQAEADPKSIHPLGPATEAAFGALQAVRAKIDDFFARCRLAEFDPRVGNTLNRVETDYAAILNKDLSASASEIAGFPIARIEPKRALPLEGPVNPAWASALASFRSTVVAPLLGDRAQLTAEDWNRLTATFAPFGAWKAARAGAAVEKLGLARVRQLLAGSAKADLEGLIARDLALEPEFKAIASVDKLVRFHRDLYRLLNNFVCFSYFYGRRERSIFQAGTLYLDQRSCDLCIRVTDMGKHATMASLSGAYLAYCDCVRQATGEKMTIAAAFTDGDSDNLMVGRNGVFYDRQGRDWDATITKIIDNPISIRQAFWAPYKKLARFIEDQIGKRAAAADAAANEKLTGAALSTTKVVESGKAPDAKPKLDTGLIAALGVAAAGLGGMIGGVVSSFLGLGPLMPLGLMGLILLISGPSMLLAALKLRKRNLGPLLDANGWAVNARARINIPFGGSLTGIATLPPGAERSLEDPFADKKQPWALYVTLLVLIAGIVGALWYQGVFR